VIATGDGDDLLLASMPGVQSVLVASLGDDRIEAEDSFATGGDPCVVSWARAGDATVLVALSTPSGALRSRHM